MHELRVEGGDPFIEAAPFSAQILDQNPHPQRQTGFALVGGDRKRGLQLVPAMCDDDAALQQQRAQTVDQCGALCHQRERARCKDWMSDCASLLTGTKRIVGRVAASAIASASWSSFLLAFT